MARILTGIQSTNTPHLGNILGAILPAIAQSQNQAHQSLFFIADWHSLTSIKDAKAIHNNTLSVAATWLAFGLNPETTWFYRQSRVPQVSELAWYLNCFTPYPMLANAHSFKDKSNRLSDVNAGLFTYPVLMAADILLYDANLVPVGKDQMQHLEITADIARSVNHRMQQEVFTVPEVLIHEHHALIPGTDGQKMSKSYNNYINIFLPEKELRQVINHNIITDSSLLQDAKDPHSNVICQLIEVVAGATRANHTREKLMQGGYGWGHAKSDLVQAILETYAEPRQRYNHYINHESELEALLQKGEARAKAYAQSKLQQVRQALGYKG